MLINPDTGKLKLIKSWGQGQATQPSQSPPAHSSSVCSHASLCQVLSTYLCKQRPSVDKTLRSDRHQLRR